MARVSVVEDALLTRLAANPLNVLKFPFLQGAAARPAAGCCGEQRPNLSALKAAVASLPNDRLAEFKKLVGADRLRVIYQLAGQTTDVTL